MKMTPTTTLEVIGLQSSTEITEITAIIDTGFQGDLLLPISQAKNSWVGFERLCPGHLGGRISHEPDGLRRVRSILGKIRQAEIFVADTDAALVGTELLSDCQLVVDFPNQKVSLFRSEPVNKQS
jgi:hypothetical protein